MTTFSRRPLVNLGFKIGILALSGVLFLGFGILSTISAQTMSNDQYKIKFGNINSEAGVSSSSSYNLNQSLGQISPGLYSGTNYTVRAGFEYYKSPSNNLFSFAISNTLLDFGIVTPTNPVLRTTDLTVTAPFGGYTVTQFEDKPLTSSSSAAIPDTSCDGGDCAPSKSGLWASTLSFGFGYRCDDLRAKSCLSDFSKDFYRPFAPSTAPQTIMTNSSFAGEALSQITYKVNVSGSQAPGVYTNTVTYIANPGF